MRPGTLWITGESEVDDLVNTDPLALLIGMLLDQQIAIELAFRGPSRLKARLGGALDAATIADWDPNAFVAICAEKPALHRFPGSMAGRIQELCRHVADTYDGDASRIWKRRRHADTVAANLAAVPGYGEEKAKILLAVLGKRFGVCPRVGRRRQPRSATTSRARLPTWAAPRNDSPCAPGRRRRRQPAKPSTSEPSTNKLSDGYPS